MSSKAHILILLLILLVIPASTVLACGNSSEKEKTEKTSCSKEDSHAEKMSCCDTGEKGDDGCVGNCGHASCHCPSSVNIPVVSNNFELSNTNNFSHLVNDWTYVQHNPKAVYLSIWQPPKIS